MLQEEFSKLVDNIASMHSDFKIIVEDIDLNDNNLEKEPKPNNIRQEIRDAIKPQVDIASSLITTIKDAYDDNMDQTKRMNDALDQIKSWEQTIHGACEQILKAVEQRDGSIDSPDSIVNDSAKCSPKAFNKYIKNYTSRDFGVLELSAAIMVFYNSLA